ncbi:LacI family transcriptional regulator [Rhodobacteraceae bacterium ASV31]|nr:LacI family transcriptional regulator [Anianabacter salinae]
MTKRRVTLDDLAARCGVSPATVSRALSDRPGVRPDLRARVREAAQSLGYALPSKLKGQRVTLVASEAAMADYARNQFTLHVLEGLRARAEARGLELEIRTAAVPFEATFAAARDTAGYLLLSPETDAQIEALAALGVPAVIINSDDPMMRLSSVAPCNRTAAALATDRLIALAHRDILFLTRPGRRTIARRREGWAERMRAEGLCADNSRVIEVSDWLPALAAEAVAARVAAGRDFTAILAAGDSLATGALLGLARAGVDVPGEVSVMGFDGLPQCDLQSPPLSALEIPMQAIGALALDLLSDTLSMPDLPPRRVELACRIVERGSTGPRA